MKIIDILNLIANREFDKLPKKIKYNGIIWINDREWYLKENETSFNLFEDYIENTLIDSLNDEVEITEEPKIEELINEVYSKENDDIEETNLFTTNTYVFWNCDLDNKNIIKTLNKMSEEYSSEILRLKDKLNEVIRKLNKESE